MWSIGAPLVADTRPPIRVSTDLQAAVASIRALSQSNPAIVEEYGSAALGQLQDALLSLFDFLGFVAPELQTLVAQLRQS